MSYRDYLSTTIGKMCIRSSSTGITHLFFTEEETKNISSNSITEKCKRQLIEYLTGERKHFDLPLDQQGTHFQQQVWQALLDIPYGQVTSYGEIAQRIDNPKAIRAVGAANGKNPISIIIPCHRIIGLNGKLTGYAGGLSRKEWLLRHEGAQY